MRLYYLDESQGPTHYVRTAIGINEEVWNQAFLNLKDWRKDVMRLYGIPLFKELHASDLLAGRGLIIRKGRSYERIEKKAAADLFISGLQRLETMASALSGGLEVINVSLPSAMGKNRELDSLDRILNRIQRSVKEDNIRAFLIFDEGKERQVAYWYRKMRVYNPIPSKYGRWATGEAWKSIPIESILGGPAFRSSAGDYFIQMADFVAHALLKQDEKPPIARIARYELDKAFAILREALNLKASGDDPQGVVRR